MEQHCHEAHDSKLLSFPKSYIDSRFNTIDIKRTIPLGIEQTQLESGLHKLRQKQKMINRTNKIVHTLFGTARHNEMEI